jgi:hypothetical protein
MDPVTSDGVFFAVLLLIFAAASLYFPVYMGWIEAVYDKNPVPQSPNAASIVIDNGANKADAAVPNQLNFQTPATAIMEKIVDLHHDLMFFIIAIVVFVSWMLGRMLYFYNSENTATPRVAFAHHTVLEII